jgi:uncharacterized membrane protein YccC
MHVFGWLRARDAGLGALRRACRTAIVMPGLFAVGDKVLHNGQLATFAAFGSFALLLLVDFRGPMADRVQAQIGLCLVGAAFVCIGTLASRWPWLAALVMAIVGFVVLFTGVVSSVLAGATTALLLSLILPVSLSAPVSALPDRLAGWGIAAAASVIAISGLWPLPVTDPLRTSAVAACRALGRRVRAEAGYLLGGETPLLYQRYLDASQASDTAAQGLRHAFLATPYRPTGLTTATRTTVRLVDELTWLNTTVIAGSEDGLPPKRPQGAPENDAVCGVKLAAVDVLERSADLLAETGGDPTRLQTGVRRLREAVRAMAHNATGELPVHHVAPAGMSDERISEFVTSLEPSFRAQELSFAVSLVAQNVELTAAAERRTWVQRFLGHQPDGVQTPLGAAQERAAAHIDRHSVWLHNSVRGAIGLGLAVLVATTTGVQHSFWVVLGTLSVLRSNALNTGQNVLHGLLGTVGGFVVGSLVLSAIGTDHRLLWAVLPVAILLAGIAPAAISFAAGQAAFTLTVVILFNILEPQGWRVGLLRVEDVAIGCAVSLMVGVLFWPRGAHAELSKALGEAYAASADYLATAVDHGMSLCITCPPGSTPAPPPEPALRAAAAARRLDDTFRNFLAERGPKPTPLPDVARLVTGVAGLRLAGDAVLDLWRRDDGTADGDRSAARKEVLDASRRIRAWYDQLADDLVNGAPIREPVAHDKGADGRLIEAVRRDLSREDGRANATAVRMIWTGGHLDAARRLQATLTESARRFVERQAAGPMARKAGKPAQGATAEMSPIPVGR